MAIESTRTPYPAAVGQPLDANRRAANPKDQAVVRAVRALGYPGTVAPTQAERAYYRAASIMARERQELAVAKAALAKTESAWKSSPADVRERATAGARTEYRRARQDYLNARREFQSSMQAVRNDYFNTFNGGAWRHMPSVLRLGYDSDRDGKMSWSELQAVEKDTALRWSRGRYAVDLGSWLVGKIGDGKIRDGLPEAEFKAFMQKYFGINPNAFSRRVIDKISKGDGHMSFSDIQLFLGKIANDDGNWGSSPAKTNPKDWRPL
jgi:hypothetical protein